MNIYTGGQAKTYFQTLPQNLFATLSKRKNHKPPLFTISTSLFYPLFWTYATLQQEHDSILEQYIDENPCKRVCSLKVDNKPESNMKFALRTVTSVSSSLAICSHSQCSNSKINSYCKSYCINCRLLLDLLHQNK